MAYWLSLPSLEQGLPDKQANPKATSHSATKGNQVLMKLGKLFTTAA